MAATTSTHQIAEAYRTQVFASGNVAELAAIDGMSDEFVAAIAQGDFAAATAALEAEAEHAWHLEANR